MGEKTNIYSFVLLNSSFSFRFGSFVVGDVVALLALARIPPSSTPFDLHPAHFRQQMGGTCNASHPSVRSSFRLRKVSFKMKYATADCGI